MWFRKKNVHMISGVKEYEEITNKGLLITNKKGERQMITANTIVPALPLSPSLELYNSLEGKVPELYAIGDCKEPLLIADAVSKGMETARSI